VNRECYRYLSNDLSCEEGIEINYEINYEEDQKEVIEVFQKTLLQETTDDNSDSSILRPMPNMKKHMNEEQNIVHDETNTTIYEEQNRMLFMR
jgi:hypothetical protein